MSTTDDLTATLVLLFEAAKPEPHELAKAVVAASLAYQRDKKWSIANAIDNAFGFISLVGVDVDYMLDRAVVGLSYDDVEHVFTGTYEQALIALRDACPDDTDYDTTDIYDEATEALRRAGLIVPKPTTTEETDNAL